MIKGIGVDSVEKDRISKIYAKHGHRFQEKILSSSEKRELTMKPNNFSKIRYLSNNFACKEALSKVLGLGFTQGVSIKEIEVLRNEKGSPFINLLGKTREIARDLNIKNITVSITDTKNISTAFVVGEEI